MAWSTDVAALIEFALDRLKETPLSILGLALAVLCALPVALVGSNGILHWHFAWPIQYHLLMIVARFSSMYFYSSSRPILDPQVQQRRNISPSALMEAQANHKTCRAGTIHGGRTQRYVLEEVECELRVLPWSQRRYS